MSAFITNRKNMVLKDPNFVKTLLNNPISGLLWLVVRVWVGLQWLNAGLHKLETPAWVQTCTQRSTGPPAPGPRLINQSAPVPHE